MRKCYMPQEDINILPEVLLMKLVNIKGSEKDSQTLPSQIR